MAAGPQARDTRRRSIALLCAIAATLLIAAPARAASVDAPWTGSGPGSSVVSDGSAADPQFGYSTRTDYWSYGPSSWTFDATSAAGGAVPVHYDYGGYHAFFEVTVGLSSFVTHDGTTSYTTLVADGPVDCCSAPSGGFHYAGDVTFAVAPGDTYGFVMTGSNADSDNRLIGTLTLSTPDSTPPTPDSTPPTTTISPAAGAWAGSLGVTATDDLSGVAATRCWVDPTTAPTSYDSAGGGDCPTTLGDGSHDVYAASIDNAGNAETPVEQTVQIDATTPVTTDDAPTGAQNTDTTVTLTPSTGGSPTTTHYTVDGGAEADGTSVEIPAPADHGNDGTHAILYWTSDDAGNVEDAHATSVTIDTTPPSVTFTPASPLTLSEGATHAFGYKVDDPGDAAGLVATPSCGSAVVPTAVAFDAATGIGSFSCAFPNGPATANVGVAAADDLNGAGTGATRAVTVLDLAPRVRMAAANPLAAADGATQAYSYSISDAGNDAISGVITDCGAHGTKVAGSDAFTSAGGSFSCTFADGPATSSVTARATDIDGLTGNAGLQTVAVAAPVIAAPPVGPGPSTGTGTQGATGAAPAGDAPGKDTSTSSSGSAADGAKPGTGSAPGTTQTQAQSGTPAGSGDTTSANSQTARWTGRYAAPRRGRKAPAKRLALTLTRAGSAVSFTTRATLVCGTRTLTGVLATGTGAVAGTTFNAVGATSGRDGAPSIRASFAGTFGGQTVRGTLEITATRRLHGRTIRCRVVRATGVVLAPVAGATRAG